MYLMSASKSKKARKLYEQSLPYFKQVAVTLSEILSQTGHFDTPYLRGYGEQENAGNLFFVLSADKGLSGGYLHNIITLLERSVNKQKDTCWVAGVTGRHKISAKGFPVSRHFRYPVSDPDLYMTREVGDKLINEFKTGRYKSVRMVFSTMTNAMNIMPHEVQLLPLKPESLDEHAETVKSNPYAFKALFEPSPAAVFEQLVPSYVKGVVYGAFVDAYTGEQSARMVAMDNSTKNAAEMLGKLTLMYNRVRQSKITQEINEIVGGIPSE
jgi:F-type H+-transporting ATPase subunit gamma